MSGDRSFNEYFRDLNWINNDNPEANQAMMDGLRTGFDAYKQDKIVQRFDCAAANVPPAPFTLAPQTPLIPPPRGFDDGALIGNVNPPLQFPTAFRVPPGRRLFELDIPPTPIATLSMPRGPGGQEIPEPGAYPWNTVIAVDRRQKRNGQPGPKGNPNSGKQGGSKNQ